MNQVFPVLTCYSKFPMLFLSLTPYLAKKSAQNGPLLGFSILEAPYGRVKRMAHICMNKPNLNLKLHIFGYHFHCTACYFL